MQIILVSGLSGAGKSTALKVLEDSGYFCVDNLPVPLLPQLIATYEDVQQKKIAVSIDTRSNLLLEKLPEIAQEIKHKSIQFKALYLEARNDILIKRFSETRRRHPLSQGNKTINDCIDEERDLLEKIGQISHKIDTSDLSANTLRNFVKEFVNADFSQLNIIVQSFGFKHGVPIDSDFVFDVRCLPNPYYDEKIRHLNGLDKPIIEYLSNQSNVNLMINDIYKFLNQWISEFARDNRNYLTISIGCTGGQHRSVYIVEQLFAHLASDSYNCLIRHRQLVKKD